MILYTLVTLVTILLSIMVSKASYNIDTTRQQLMNKICLAAIFCVLFLLCALRVGVGNDYLTYIQNAHEINVGGVIVTEPGYNLVVKLLYMLAGSENYILLFAVFGFCTTYIFMKSMYEQSDLFAISFLLFMTWGIYFRSFNTVRYYFVLALTLYSLKYVVKKEYIKFIALMIFAAFFHKSVLVVIPMYLICNREWKRWFYVVVSLGTVALFAGKNIIMDIAIKLYPSYKDTIYLTQDVGLRANLPGIFRCALIVGFCILFFKEAIKDNKANTLYFNMTIMSLCLYIGGSFIPMVSRFGYYLITAQVLLVPGVYTRLTGKKKKLVLYAIIAVAVVYFVYFLFTASKPGISVLPYKSWVFDGVEWNNIEDVLTYNNR